MMNTKPESDLENVCPKCHDRGYIIADVPVGDPLFGKAIPCQCKRQEMQEKRRTRLRTGSSLAHLTDMTFENFDTMGMGSPILAMVLQDAKQSAYEFAENPKGWLLLTGSYGSGKTHLAAAIANYRAERALLTEFLVVPDLLDHLRATYAPNSEVTYDQRFDELRNVPVLILDDLGTHSATPWAQEKLYQLLNYRYNAELPTVITTNKEIEDMDPRLASRLRSRNLVKRITLKGPDYRTRANGEFLPSSGDVFGSLNPYENMTFGTFKDRRGQIPPRQSAELRRIRDQLEQYAEAPGKWLILCGSYGVGKTHLAAAIANKLARSGEMVMFVVVPDLLDHLRETFGPNSQVSYDQRFDQVRFAPVLVLDDLGTHSATRWAQEKLFQIINYRHVRRTPTIITVGHNTPSGDPDPWNNLDERLKSRLSDTSFCTLIEIDVPSYRSTPPSPPSVKRSTRERK